MKNDSQRDDLNVLRADLERVEMDLRFLRVKADQLEERIVFGERGEVEAVVDEAPPLIEEFATPPPLPLAEPESVAPEPEPAMAAPPIIPEERMERFFAPMSALPPIVPAEATRSVTAEAAEPESFEMRLGTYWFVRIGVVMVLTALVFLGNYAYQHYIGLLGPWGKVALMYGASFGLMAAGKFLPSRQERLKNYGQALFGGGLAAVYFTTYAAHHFPNLRVIASPLLDGSLLLGWTAFIVWLADRNKSEALAVFAIGLAYYTALITNVGSFTLLSNLTLAAAAVFFLVRNRWVNLTFLSLVASYGSYFYWRYYAGSAGGDVLAGRLAIIGYWTIFTAAIFLTRHEGFAGRRRASFLSFNNGAAFCLLAASYYHQHEGNFWKLALMCGGVLLALAALARKYLAEDELPRRAYLAQGLLLTTLGLITKLSGPTLALVLAVESAWLLVFATQWKSRLMRTASALVALLAAGWLVMNLQVGDATAWWRAAGVFGFLLFDAVWIGRRSEESGEARPLPVYFAFLALATWTSAVYQLADPVASGVILTATGFALTFAHYGTRVREITYLAQGLVALGQGQTFLYLLEHSAESPWGIAGVIVMSIILALWWKQQTILAAENGAKLGLQLISAFAGAAIAYGWLPQLMSADGWIFASVIVTAGWTLLGVATRSWPLAATGQMFLVGTALQTLARLVDRHEPPWANVTVLIVGFVALAAAARFLKRDSAAAQPLRAVSHIYQWAAAILSIASVMTYVDSPLRFFALAILFAISLAATMLGATYAFGPGLAMAAVGLVWWLLNWNTSGAEIQNLGAIVILGLAQIILRKKPERVSVIEPAHFAWIAAVAGALWFYVSRWVIVEASGAHFYLTASWALLAFVFFAIGFGLRERGYRWAALTVLGFALGRVVILDVWRLETLYRILSFFALGIVLLALGYMYTRFQEKIARWL